MRGLDTILKEHPLFKELEEDQIQFICGCGRNRVFAPGEVMAHSGDSADHFYVLREGKVSVQLHTIDRGAVTLQTMGPGDVIGWSWLFPPYQWSFDITAIQQTRVIEFDGRCVRGKCEEDHDLGYRLMKSFSQLMVQRLEATRMQVLDVYKIAT